MTVSREDAIRFATEFANTNGYRVVPTFDGVFWTGRDQDGARPVMFAAARWIDGEWSVLFDKMLPPEVESECSGDTCVVVNGETGACRFYPVLSEGFDVSPRWGSAHFASGARGFRPWLLSAAPTGLR